MVMGLPYTSLIESLENEVGLGRFTAWSCAHANGMWAAFYADETCPPAWYLDQIGTSNSEQKQTHDWMPAFDLASLTKPLLANSWLRHMLGADSLLWMKSPLASLIDPRSNEGVVLKKWCEARPSLTLSDLLNHTSGLRAWTWFGRALWKTETQSNGTRTRAISRTADLQHDSSGFTARQAQEELTSYILSLPTDVNGTHPQTVYSDLNYYLLARVIENLAMHPFKGWAGLVEELNQLWSSQFWHASLDPERSQNAVPFHPYVHSQVVAHIYENRKLINHAGEYGAVHDTNANILATEFRSSSQTFPLVSSHAGLFGSVVDVAKALPFLISTQRDFESLNAHSQTQKSRFSWGLDTPGDAGSTAGLHTWPLPKDCSVFGHLGYTGTSLWMADDGQFHVLLTNRTARRTVLGSSRIPRVLIYKPGADLEPSCWLKWSQTSPWQPSAWQDALTLCFESNRTGTRYWDRQHLRKPPDLAFVRRNTGQHLWSH